MSALCVKCGYAGAGSDYNGELYHMTCLIEQKRADGLIGETPVGKLPRAKLKKD